MVTFQDIQTAHYMVAATGVLVAAIYYILNIQNNKKNQELMLKTQQQTLETRKAAILQSLLQTFSSQVYADAWHDVVFNQNYLTYEE